MLDLALTLAQSAERSPRALAIADGAVRLTYADWYERVSRLAGGLASLGLARGDHLVSVLQNRWEAAALHWACQVAGVTLTPLNWRAKADEVAYCLADAEARAVAFEPASEAALWEAPGARSLPRIGVGEASGSTHTFADLCASEPIPARAPLPGDTTSVMLYTSGTTGRPKGVPRTHAAERAAALAHVAQNAYLRGERTLGVMPLYHTMGVRSLLATALVDGLFVCLPKFDAAAALDLIEAERITCLYLVPTLYHDLIHHPAFSTKRVATVRKLGFAGASMPEALLRKLENAFAPELFVNHYGSSEIYTFTVEPRAAARPGSAGRAGLNARIRVVRLGAHRPVERAAANEEGEIIADLTGDEAFAGYWKRPDADARALREGWYFTGDTGYLDEDGDLFVTGRVDDMIISGGENISPSDIESVLSLHPGVREVAVAGLPDERWGQRVTAFVVRDGAVSPDALDAHCLASELVNYKRPREYVFVRELPKSPVGKLLRRKLVAGEYDPDPT